LVWIEYDDKVLRCNSELKLKNKKGLCFDIIIPSQLPLVWV